MNKVLIITYYWPPSGGSGVQRWLKFQNICLNPDGTLILTVAPEFAAYPVKDNSLMQDLPSSIRIFTTRQRIISEYIIKIKPYTFSRICK